MRGTKRIAMWLRALLSRRSMESELDEEMRFHIECAQTQYRERGYSAQEAARRARLDFGGVERAQEEVRDLWLVTRLADLARDVRLGIRGFRKRVLS